MSPHDRFLFWLQFDLNRGAAQEGGTIVVDWDRSDFEQASDGTILSLGKVILRYVGSVDFSKIVPSLIRAMARLGTKVWADQNHLRFLVGRARPIVAVELGKDSALLCTLDPANDVHWAGGRPGVMEKDIDSTVERSFHDEAAECRSGKGVAYLADPV